MKRLQLGLLVMLGTLAGAVVFPAAGGANVVKVTTTIEAAIGAASPGDTIVVPPGTYHEGNLVVTQDDLTIRGSKAAVLKPPSWMPRVTRPASGSAPGPSPAIRRYVPTSRSTTSQSRG